MIFYCPSCIFPCRFWSSFSPGPGKAAVMPAFYHPGGHNFPVRQARKVFCCQQESPSVQKTLFYTVIIRVPWAYRAPYRQNAASLFYIPGNDGYGNCCMTFPSCILTCIRLLSMSVSLRDTFRYPGPGGIDEHEDGPVLEIVNRRQDIFYFVFRKDQRKGFGYLGGRKVFFRPIFVINVGKKEPQCVIPHFDTARFVPDLFCKSC